MKKIRKKLLMFFISFCIFSSYFVLGHTENIFTSNTKAYAATISKVVKVNSVSLNKGKDTLTATVAPSNATNKSIGWSTSNSKVATVYNSIKYRYIILGGILNEKN